MTATSNDVGSLTLGDNVYQNVILQSPGSATYAVGTIMARKDLSATLAVAYTRAGTSTYTVVASCHTSVSLELGAYTITAGTLSSGVGTWTAVSPITGATETFTSTADTDHLLFPNLGLTLTVTAGGGTTWDTGDVITVTTAADGDYVIYDPDGKGGCQIPVAVLPSAYTVAGTDLACNVIVGGRVNKNRLVINDGTTVTDVHVQMLRHVGIHAIDQDNLSFVDNIV